MKRQVFPYTRLAWGQFWIPRGSVVQFYACPLWSRRKWISSVMKCSHHHRVSEMGVAHLHRKVVRLRHQKRAFTENRFAVPVWFKKIIASLGKSNHRWRMREIAQLTFNASDPSPFVHHVGRDNNRTYPNAEYVCSAVWQFGCQWIDWWAKSKTMYFSLWAQIHSLRARGATTLC